LHKSSVFVGIVVGIILVLIMIPGRIVGGAPWSWMTLEHGWPFNYLRREAVGRAPAPQGFNPYSTRQLDLREHPMLGIPWLNTDTWRLWVSSTSQSVVGNKTPHWDFDGIVLVFDCGIALLLLIAIVSAWEIRRRRRPALFCFRLSDILFSVALLSVVLGWLVYSEREFHREDRIIDSEWERKDREEEFDTDGWYADEFCIAPKWIRSLIGERVLPYYFWRTSAVEITPENGQRLSTICSELSNFTYLTNVVVQYENEFQGFPYSKLSGVRQLEEIWIDSYWNHYLNDADIRELAQLTQLKKIVLYDKGDHDPGRISQLEKELHGCKIVDSFDDW
jgi:hypothetical protein